MMNVVIEPHFDAWRNAARSLLAHGVSPQDVIWEKEDSQAACLLAFDGLPAIPPGAPPLKVPCAFVRLARTVCAHRSGKQWAILYELLWEMKHGLDRRVLSNQTDDRVRALERMRATVSRDIHKMRAFVRFRQVGEEGSDNEHYVAWYEPDHRIVRLNSAFFCKRFGGMRWSILTPDECAHWDGQRASHTVGVEKSMAPEGDQFEELWLGYYQSIFNPARLKIKMMQTEMPKKYWKNLPEAEVIEELIRKSSGKVQSMMEEHQRPLKPEPRNAYLSRLRKLNG